MLTFISASFVWALLCPVSPSFPCVSTVSPQTQASCVPLACVACVCVCGCTGCGIPINAAANSPTHPTHHLVTFTSCCSVCSVQYNITVYPRLLTPALARLVPVQLWLNSQYLCLHHYLPPCLPGLPNTQMLFTNMGSLGCALP